MSLTEDMRDIMAETEYRLVCSDASAEDRHNALVALQDWCGDLAVTVRTGVPMADSDR